MDKIENWRKKIDEIDLKLVDLLNHRERCAIAIGKIKAVLNIEVYDSQREKEVLENVQHAVDEPLTKEAVKNVFERIIEESRRAEGESNSLRKDLIDEK